MSIKPKISTKKKTSFERVQAEICKKSFKKFVNDFWDEVPGSQPLIWNWHMDVICDELELVANRVFKRLPKLYDLIINISPATSKPVWEGSKVLMGDGSYKSLKNIKVGDYVIGKSGLPCKVEAVHEQGDLPCVKISTTAGREIYAAVDHPILTADGWKIAGEIQPDQMLAIMHRPQIQATSTRSDDDFRLAGYFIGDGSTSCNNCALTSKDPEYIDDFTECAKRMGFDCRITVAKNGVTIISPKARKQERQQIECANCGKLFTTTARNKQRCCSMKCGGEWTRRYNRGECEYVEKSYSKTNKYSCRDWLREVGIAGKNSYTKKIPDFVWNGTNKQIAIFLAAYFHCDGCVSWKHKNDNLHNISVSFATVSKSLAKGVQRLLIRLGINMRVNKNIAKNGFTYNRGLKNYVYYTVSTTDQDTATRFMELIPLIGRKKDKLKEYLPTKRTFNQEYWPDRVTAVEEYGYLPCRCLTVKEDQSFTVDNVVVHNSTLVSILYPCWVWANMPEGRIISASHATELVLDLSNKARQVIKGEKYQTYYPEIILRDDQDTKCLSKGTEILMADGTLCPIEKLEVGNLVQSSYKNKIIQDEVVAVVDTGNQPVFEIKLADGEIIQATGKHRLHSWNKWVRVEDLQVGDCLTVARKTNSQQGDLTKDDAFLLALWLTEGTKGKGACGYKITTTGKQIIERASNIASSRGWNYSFGNKKRLTLKNGSKKNGDTPTNVLRCNGLVASNGRDFVKTDSIRVPNRVHSASEDVVKEFLATLISCDGHIARSSGVCITTISKKFAFDIQMLYKRLGVRSKIYSSKPFYTKNKQRIYCKTAWHVVVKRRDSLRKLSCLNIYDKQDKLACLLEWKNEVRENGMVIPPQWRNDLANKYRQIEVGKYGWSTYTRVKSVALLECNTDLISKIDGDLAWREIISIVQIGELPTYDIQTKNYNRFFANGVLSHNSYYANTQGGDRYTCTVSGKSPIGFHSHWLLVDDPLDPKKAVSDVELKEAQDFFDNVLPSRKVDKEVSVTILVMQRLHEVDPSGHWLKQAKKIGATKIKHYRLPAEVPINEYGERETSLVIPAEFLTKYEEKQWLMDPRRLPRNTLEELKVKSQYSYAGQYLQHPVPLGGGMFKNTYFNQRVKAAPYTAKRIRYYDRAASAGTGCRTAGVLMSMDSDNRFYIEHVLLGQWEPKERNDKMKAAALRDRSRYGPRNEPVIWIEREGGASGRDAFREIARFLAGFQVREHNITGMGKKEVRAESLSSMCASMNVYLVEDGSWDIEEFISELCLFPNGQYKDQTDAASGAYNLLVNTPKATGFRVITTRTDKNTLKIYVCNKEQVPELEVTQNCAYISVQDPHLVPYTITPPWPRLKSSETASFADVETESYQDRWNGPLPEFNLLTIEQIALSLETAKKIWRFVLNSIRNDDIQAIVIQDNGKEDRRAISLAYSLCDSLRFFRDKSISVISKEEMKHEGLPAPNKYVYNMVKKARSMVA